MLLDKVVHHYNMDYMTKRVFLFFLVFLIMIPGFSMDLTVDIYPYEIDMVWDDVESAVLYKVYQNSDYEGETEDTFWSLGSYKHALWPESSYTVKITAIDKDGNILDVAEKKCKTGSLAGVYVWNNPTDKTNNGKCKSLCFTVKEIQGGVYSIYSNNEKIFPMVNKEEIKVWHSWDENSETGKIYRENADKFNTTSFSPSSWAITEINNAPNYYRVITKSKLAGLTFTTETSCIFRFDKEKNISELLFMTEGKGLAGKSIFKNPAPGREGENVFVLTRQ